MTRFLRVLIVNFKTELWLLWMEISNLIRYMCLCQLKNVIVIVTMTRFPRVLMVNFKTELLLLWMEISNLIRYMCLCQLKNVIVYALP